MTHIKRVIKNGWATFRRNGLLSTATILMMTMTLFVMGGLLLLSVITNTVLTDLENKIDFSIYFVPGADERQILKIKDEITPLSQVKEVTYASESQVLAAFKERHKGDAVISASLAELEGDNPLGATLNIKAKNPRELASIADFLTNQKYDFVDKINYFENQNVIEGLSSVVASARSVGLAIVLLLAAVAVLIAFNTVRLAIYSAREEINIMKLVGASNWFVRGPFIITGILHGLFAALLTCLLFFPIMWFASPKVSFLLPNIQLFQYFLANFSEFFLLIMSTGIVLGIFSSAIAVRRYLKV